MAKSLKVEMQCPMDITINILSGKWKMPILWHLTKGTIRFNELLRRLPDITQKTLTQQLKELEQASMISRKVYPEIPPKVEYSLSKIGESIKPVLDCMCQWGKEYQKEFSHIDNISQ